MSPRQTATTPKARRKATPATAKPATTASDRAITAPALADASATPTGKSRPRSAPKNATVKAGSSPAPAAAKTRATTGSRSASRSASVTPLEARAVAAVDRKNTPISEITLANITPQTLIAPNFMVYELTRSELADRRGINNYFPSDKELRAAIHLAREVLQPIRDALGKFTPNSVFRGNPLERALKNKPASWLSTSQHSRGEACDIEIVGMSTLALAEWARDNLTFDQIICECYDPAKGPNSGWVHISLKAPGTGENRGQLLSYIASHGKMVYVPGLVADVA